MPGSSVGCPERTSTTPSSRRVSDSTETELPFSPWRGMHHGPRFGIAHQEVEQDLPRCAAGGGRALPVSHESERGDRALAAQARRGTKYRLEPALPRVRDRP